MFQPGRMLDQELISAPGRSGNTKRQQPLVLRQLDVAAHHVAHVLFGQLVVRQVNGRRSRVSRSCCAIFGSSPLRLRWSGPRTRGRWRASLMR